jgi:hybrid cluster-associated redox disulfide protein
MITRDMTIAEILVRYPQTLAVFRQFGLTCQECQIADFEAIEHGAGVHKLDIDLLLRELNKAIGC